MEEFKVLVVDELIKYVLLMFFDFEYGFLVIKVFDLKVGFFFVYEKIGYDIISIKCLLDCLDVWFVKCIKEEGVDVVKFLFYYDVDSLDEFN